MTEAEKISLEHRLTETEDRSKSNKRRIEDIERKLQENSDLIGAIRELAVETKHMREDINKTISRLDALENKDSETWEKFKWLLVAGVVSIVLGYLAVSVGLSY